MATAKMVQQLMLAADSVVFNWNDGDLRLLLIKRSDEPFKGLWALPGGFVDLDEDLDKAAKRELKEETGLRLSTLEQFKTFGHPKRDPRGRVISVVYLALVGEGSSKLKAGDDAAEADWLSVSKLPKLSFDHKNIVKEALVGLKQRVIKQLDGEEVLAESFSKNDMRELLLHLYSIE